MGTGSPNESSSQPESALANTHRHKRQKVGIEQYLARSWAQSFSAKFEGLDSAHYYTFAKAVQERATLHPHTGG